MLSMIPRLFRHLRPPLDIVDSRPRASLVVPWDHHERAPPFPRLITPSVSPPIIRPWQHTRDIPPAAKRRRLSSTPSSSSILRASTSRQPSVAPALESSNRLFEFWDSLAVRYNKPLDEDDIVDLRDLALLKDRGVTRAAVGTYEIGSLTAPPVEDDAASHAGEAEEEEDEEGESVDESADELDLLAQAPPPPPVATKLEYYKRWVVPPADAANPEDLEAFREFEEAERQRRELGGLDVDYDDGPEDSGPPASFSSDPGPFSALTDLGDDKEEEPLDLLPPRRRSPNPPPKPRRKSRPPPKRGDSSSEDELAAWKIDDTPIPRRRSAPPSDVIDLTGLTPSSPVQPPPTHGRPLFRARSRARSKSKPPAPAPQKRPETPDPDPAPPSPIEPVQQLLTPPRSTSAPDSARPAQDANPLPRESPSPQFPKVRARYTPRPRPRTPSDDEDVPAGPSSRPFPAPFPIGPPKKAKKTPRRPRSEVEVVITTSSRKPGTSRGQPPAEPPQPPSTPPPKRKRAKGKAKVAEAQPSPPEDAPVASKPKRRSQSQPRAPSSRAKTPESPQPLSPSIPRGKKRRRVSSLSAMSDISPVRAQVASSPTHSVRSSLRGRNNFPAGSQDGYSSDIPPRISSDPPDVEDDEDEDPLLHLMPPVRAPSRARSSAPQIPLAPVYPHMAHPYASRHGDRTSFPASASGHGRNGSVPDARHMYSTPAPPLQDPQAQFMLAQAWHSLSYLMASGALPPPPPSGPGYSFPTVAPRPPYTPSHQRYRTRPAHGLDTPSSSSEAGPSRAGPAYATPTHHAHSYAHSHPHPAHGYSYGFGSGFSDGTLPPSSPISSLRSSPMLRPASVPPGQRSRSRGRRVSFRLDADDRPLPPPPPSRREEEEEEEEDADDDDDSEQGPHYARQAQPRPQARSKGKARAAFVPAEEEEESCDEDVPSSAYRNGRPLPVAARPPTPARGRAPQRAQTPAPPSYRDKGSSARGAQW
ncbi:uncharacterized protein BXZ73DRAFT_104005 [Epithele typhae]|uniref:uncharacterized protein n=1 Tax=Epithele typhae TaxID=378194 RepID=UPI00200726EB|nr:uncharacterized protein BXZ73DRAFT_104005 [Epithele typhae]KAH9922772.1 hypothetical protein BXZ73DRAFT_104005 [Epithele typhae]